ncbi:MAG: putative bifunctional diguanylate cyclase/phosphodiesterase [Betaproteobacteria bacterium]
MDRCDENDGQGAKPTCAQLAAIFQSSDDAIVSTTLGGRILTWNRGAERMFGYSAQQAVGMPLLIIVPDRAVAHLEAQVPAIASGAPVRQFETQCRRRDGNLIDVSVTISPIVDAADKVTGTAAIIRDMTEQKRTAERLAHVARCDRLTDLLNREAFCRAFEQAVDTTRRERRQGALLRLELNRFRLINEELGVRAGDEVLVQTADRLTRLFAGSALLARLGPDCFGISLNQVSSAGEAEAAARRALAALSQPIEVAGEEVFPVASIGIALFPENDKHHFAILSRAEAAMKRVSAAGGNGYELAAHVEKHLATGDIALERDLRRALERNEFALHYQPIVNCRTGAVEGVEALIRWHHPRLKMVSPAKFIPTAEETGLILPIGEWVLRTACRQAKRWRDAGHALFLTANISPRQFRQPQLAETIEWALRDSGLDPARLKVEITESVATADAAHAARVLAQIAELDVKIAVDDFGTGYSNLNSLRRFPFHTLKVDQSFISELGQDSPGAVIVPAVIGLAKVLGLDTVCEGVETPQQLERLQALGADRYQGYHFSRPLPVEECSALLERHAAERNGEPMHVVSPYGEALKAAPGRDRLPGTAPGGADPAHHARTA